MKTTLCFTLTLLIFTMLAFVPNSFAQDDSPEYVVRQIYFHPSDRPPSQDMNAMLDMLVKDVQQFYADEMERHGFGRKTFRFETDALGKKVRHFVKGKFRTIEYSMDIIGKAHQEINQRFDLSEHFVHLIFIVSDDNSGSVVPVGVGGNGSGYPFGGTANITLLDFHIAPNVHRLRAFNVIAHELGHAFGLPHDFRDDRYIMSYGPEEFTDQLSYCAAQWLDAHRYFNTTHNAFDEVPTIEMLPPSFVSTPNTVRLQFKITHS